jgi:hypothetical protein
MDGTVDTAFVKGILLRKTDVTSFQNQTQTNLRSQPLASETARSQVTIIPSKYASNTQTTINEALLRGSEVDHLISQQYDNANDFLK